MFKWMRENDECFKRPPVSANLIAPPAAPAAPAIPKEFLEEQRRFNAKLLEEIQNLKASNQKAADQTQKNFENLPKGPELLSQIEAKLQEHTASVTTAAPPKNNDFEAQLLERLNSLGGKVTELSETVQRPHGECFYCTLHANGLAIRRVTGDRSICFMFPPYKSMLYPSTSMHFTQTAFGIVE